MKYACIYCSTKTVQVFKGNGTKTPICKYHANHKWLEVQNLHVMTQNATKRTLFAYSKKMHRYHHGYQQKKQFLRSVHDIVWKRMNKKERPCNFVKDNSIMLTQHTYDQYVRFCGHIEWNHMAPLNLAVEKKCYVYNLGIRRYFYLVWLMLQSNNIPGDACKIIVAYAGMQSMALVDHAAFFQQCKGFAIAMTTMGDDAWKVEMGYINLKSKNKRQQKEWNQQSIPMKQYQYTY
jgi:hypothetical protein